jgi:hypothetical protein
MSSTQKQAEAVREPLCTKYQEAIDVGQTEGLVTIKSRFIPHWEVLVVPYQRVLIVSGRARVDGSRCGG